MNQTHSGSGDNIGRDKHVHIYKPHKTPPQLTSKLGKTTIIGRKKELKEIDKLLRENGSLLLINGIGGIGKSTIASYYLYSQKENYNYYGFFEGLESFANELKPRLNLKSEKPNELFLEALAKLGTLEGKKLLVLDDVKDIEENQAYIDKILELKHSGYKILITSREEIENIKLYNLNVLSLDDAKALFNSIYKIEDKALLEEILGYLDYHAFFIEKTAHSIKKTLTPKMIRDKFKNGEFAQISVKRKQNFNKFLNQLFRLDSLDSEEILMLKQLSVLPSFGIGFQSLEYIFQKKEDSEFEELLDYLCEKGWLTRLEEGYKLHQIIKEYILANHTPTFKEIEIVVDSFNALMDNSAYPQVAVNNQKNIIYFENLVVLLDRLEIENEEVGTFFNNLGLIYYHLGLYQKAELFLSKALKIRENLLENEHLHTTQSYNNLASLYLSMGEYQKAEPLYLKALKIGEKLLGENQPFTVFSYANLAVLYHYMGEYQKAEPLYLKALKIRKKILGEEHIDTAQSYNNLGGFYEEMGEYKKVKSLYLKALKIRKKILGEEHLDMAQSYNNLAEFYRKMGEYQKVEPLHIKALKIFEKLLGENHPSTVFSYANLALFYDNVGEYQKAEPLYLKALKIRKNLLGEEHQNTAQSYNNLAGLYNSMSEYQKAEPLYLKALEIWEKVLGEEHPSTAISYNNLAIFYYGQGDFERAYEFMKRAVEICSKVLPCNHPDLIDSKEGLEMIKKELTKSKNNQRGK